MIFSLRTSVLFSIGATALFFATAARADDFYIWAEEVGGNVIFHHQGSFDVTEMGDPSAGVSSGISVSPVSGQYFFASLGGGVSFERYNMTLSKRNFGDASSTTASSGSGDQIVLATTYIGLIPGYVSGNLIEGSLRFENNTLEAMGVDTTPFTIRTTIGDNTIHFFTNPNPPKTTVVARPRPDLLIGKTPRGVRGENVLNPKQPSARQTIIFPKRISQSNISVAHLLIQNDGGKATRFRLRSSGDRFQGLNAVARSAGRNVSVAVQLGRFAPRIPGGRSVRVLYRLRTDRFFAGVVRGGDRDDVIRFRLTGAGKVDNAAMVNRYR